MIDRFTLYVIVRSQVSDRVVRRQSLALEAAMAAIAPGAGVPVEHAALAGLAARIDLVMTAQNPARRGLVAEQLLQTEEVAPEVVVAVRECYRAEDIAGASRLAALLAAVDGLLERVWIDAEAEGLDEVDPRAIGVAVERAGLRRAEPSAKRVIDALAAVQLELEPTVAQIVAAMAEIRGDLGFPP